MGQPSDGLFGSLGRDLPASVVVFLVAIPLCLGIAMASGAPLISGLIAGAVGGLVVGSISRSALGVSGPAAGLAVVVLNAIEQLGSFEVFLVAVIVCGAVQMAMGLARAGFLSYFFPSSVIKGMLAGIGIIIILKQLPHAFGYDKVHEGSLAFTQADGHNTFSELWHLVDVLSAGPMVIAGVGLAILVAWEFPWPSSLQGLKKVPAALVAVVSGIVLNVLFSGSEAFALNADQLVAVPVLSSLTQIDSLWIVPQWNAFASADVWLIGCVMALVASIESLLCVEAADKLDEQKRVTPPNRELIAQGAGNLVSGILGGLPVTQVIVRSSSNIMAGARSKLSAILHGAWILVSVLLFPWVLNLIPLASLAAVLIVVGVKLARPQQFVEMYHQGGEQFIAFAATVLGLVFTDLLMGIALGMVVSVFMILWTNYRHPFFSAPDTSHPEQGVRIQLAEDMSFLNKACLMRMLSKLPTDIHVILDASQTRRMHPDIHEVIEDFLVNAPTRDIRAEFIDMPTASNDHHYHVHKVASEKSQMMKSITHPTQ